MIFPINLKARSCPGTRPLSPARPIPRRTRTNRRTRVGPRRHDNQFPFVHFLHSECLRFVSKFLSANLNTCRLRTWPHSQTQHDLAWQLTDRSTGVPYTVPRSLYAAAKAGTTAAMCIVRRCRWIDMVFVKILAWDQRLRRALPHKAGHSRRAVWAVHRRATRWTGSRLKASRRTSTRSRTCRSSTSQWLLGNWGIPFNVVFAHYGYCDCDLSARCFAQAGSAARRGARRGRSCRRRRDSTWTRSSASSVCPCVGWASATTAAHSSSVSRTFRAVSLCQLLPLLPISSRAYRRIQIRSLI